MIESSSVPQPQEKFPLVTIALIAYNQESYVRHAIEGALAQDYPNIELIVSDDASTDKTWDVMRDAIARTSSHHSIIIRKNEFNAGLATHVGQIAELMSGELLVIFAGDDVSLPNRVSRIVAAWIQNGKPEAAIHSKWRVIDGNGNPTGQYGCPRGADPARATLEQFVSRDFQAILHGATAAYTKGIFTQFEKLSGNVEDIPLSFRALLVGSVIYVDEVLVDYRVNVGNISGILRRSDRKHVLRNISCGLDAMKLMTSDYKHYCDAMKIKEDPLILRTISRHDRRYQLALGLASPSLYKNLIGLLALPIPGGIRDRLYVARKYFGL